VPPATRIRMLVSSERLWLRHAAGGCAGGSAASLEAHQREPDNTGHQEPYALICNQRFVPVKSLISLMIVLIPWCLG
jgi:hypothetical protein